MNGRQFTFHKLDPTGLFHALKEAANFRADSIRCLRVSKPLRALSWDELYEAIHSGYAKIENELVIPVIQGGGGENIYVTLPNASNAPVTIATATTRKTLLQVATPSTKDIDLVQWVCSFDASAAAQPIVIDVVETDVAATVTSLTPTKYVDPNAPASLCVGGTAATGYNASAEGTIAATRIFETVQLNPMSAIVLQYPLGREPKVAVSKFLRLRALGFSSDTPNALCSFLWRE